MAPYRLSGKRGNYDAADAAAISEAVQRPNMRFVPVESAEEQGRQMVNLARQGFVEQLTATFNRIRGLLSEEGTVLPLKAATVRRQVAALREDLPGNGHDFQNGRQLSAWIGLVPGQYSSGGKTRLGRITKAGGTDLRSLLIMDARAVLNAAAAKDKTDSTTWLAVLPPRTARR